MQKLSNQQLGRKTVDEFRQSEKTPLVIVLDNVRSALNIGSIFRTADAFLLEKIYLCGISASPPNREIQKTALGATETVEWKYFKSASDALKELREEGYLIFGIEQTTESIPLNNFKAEAGKKYAVIFGHEVNGIDKSLLEFADGCIEVPQFGMKHSLNIAVCAGIVIWDLFVKWKANKA